MNKFAGVTYRSTEIHNDGGEADEVRRARIEVLRCRRNVARGGDADFWIRRLGRAADRYEKAAATLREQIAAMLDPAPGTAQEGPSRRDIGR